MGMPGFNFYSSTLPVEPLKNKIQEIKKNIMDVLTLKIVKNLVHFDHHYNQMIVDHFYTKQWKRKLRLKLILTQNI